MLTGSAIIVLFFILFASNGFLWFMLNGLTSRFWELHEKVLRMRE